jgi:hypothetical protein
VKPEETGTARQWLSKRIPMAMNTGAMKEEVLDAVFSMQSMLRPTLNFQ